MSRRTAQRTSERALEPIHPVALAAVTGGRFAPRTTLDSVLTQGIQELSQAVMSVGQNLAAAKQGDSQQWLQLFQQLMQSRRGG